MGGWRRATTDGDKSISHRAAAICGIYSSKLFRPFAHVRYAKRDDIFSYSSICAVCQTELTGAKGRFGLIAEVKKAVASTAIATSILFNSSDKAVKQPSFVMESIDAKRVLLYCLTLGVLFSLLLAVWLPIKVYYHKMLAFLCLLPFALYNGMDFQTFMQSVELFCKVNSMDFITMLTPLSIAIALTFFLFSASSKRLTYLLEVALVLLVTHIVTFELKAVTAVLSAQPNAQVSFGVFVLASLALYLYDFFAMFVVRFEPFLIGVWLLGRGGKA